MDVKKEKITDEIRDEIIAEHFECFFDLYNAIMSNDKSFNNIMDKHYLRIMEKIRLVS